MGRLPHKRVVLLLCLPALLAAWAPPAKPSIAVSVVDSADLPVPGAQVQLKSGDQVVAHAGTDEKGQTRFEDLKPGTYSASVSKDGFATFEKGDLQLSVESEITVRLTLQP